MVPACNPISVTIGSSALRSTWRVMTRVFVQPLGAGGADEIEVQDLQHRGAHDAQIDRKEDQAERQRRQHEMRGDVEHTPDAV